MICSKCGSEVWEESKFCNICGEKIDKPNIEVTDKNNISSNIIKEEISDSKSDFEQNREVGEVTVQFNFKKSYIKKAIICLIIFIVILASGFGVYKYVQIANFNNLVKSANLKLNEGNYDQAIQLYNKALTYKKDNNVEIQLVTAQNYKQNQSTYNEGLKLIGEKKYKEAIQKLNTINQNVLPIYNSAQNKISECNKNIINDDIQAANKVIQNGDYDTANKYIDDIFKIDAGNNDAKQLKATIEQAQAKAQADALAKAAADALAKAQQQAVNTPIVINYSIDDYGYITANYDNDSNIQVKLGQKIKLIGKISPSSSKRILFDGNILDSVPNSTDDIIKAVKIGSGVINIIPNGYDWDNAYTYHVTVSN